MKAQFTFQRTIKAARWLWLASVAGALTSPLQAGAALTITSIVGGAPTGVFYVNFDNLPLGSAGGTSGGLSVSFSGGSAVVQGSVVSAYAAPYLSNSNGALFGDTTVAGPDATRYVATTASSGPITMLLPGAQLYFGLLWGSVDAGNTLTFFNASGQSVGVVTGTNVSATANGNQGAQGTFYVNIASDLPFTRVVASGAVFEFDNVAYNPSVPVAEPGTLGLLTGGLLATLAAVGRRREAARSRRR